MADEAPDAEDVESSAPEKIPSSRSNPRRRQSYQKDDVLRRFNSCGRCGLFLVGYRLHHEPEFEKAITEVEGGWLPLPWDSDMRDLVNKSYGCRTDIESYYLEGTCPECRRPFAYAEPDPEHSAWFVVKM